MLARKPRKKPGRRANQIDEAFGQMVRTKRALAGMSQMHLADALELTFQQIQKYERGTNRVAVSRLFALARALDTTPSAMIRELEEQLGLDPAPLPTAGAPAPPALQREALNVMRDYLAIEDPKLRKRIHALMRVVSPDADDA